MDIGIAPTDESVKKFNDLKMLHKHYSIVYKIEGDKDIVVEHEIEKGKTFADLKAALPKDEPRFIVVNHEFHKGDDLRQKIFLVLYTPTTTGIRKKMLYASSKNTVKSSFNGIQNELDVDESFREEDLTDKATRI
ncbi:putative Actin-depolymerizing factor 3 [Blattamonas nauphoetae]|uniref:Actin-depolymerizing factor 3 n=1 Tax=Blattamonas nauphoetae TaxID=2049346 RepID=A0ABQ9WP96_9EUKA|nr:putative Actin-depolymerizing factor 3 [Blattamonas nauphoetae]